MTDKEHTLFLECVRMMSGQTYIDIGTPYPKEIDNDMEKFFLAMRFWVRSGFKINDLFLFIEQMKQVFNIKQVE